MGQGMRSLGTALDKPLSKISSCFGHQGRGHHRRFFFLILLTVIQFLFNQFLKIKFAFKITLGDGLEMTLFHPLHLLILGYDHTTSLDKSQSDHRPFTRGPSKQVHLTTSQGRLLDCFDIFFTETIMHCTVYIHAIK